MVGGQQCYRKTSGKDYALCAILGVHYGVCAILGVSYAVCTILGVRYAVCAILGVQAAPPLIDFSPRNAKVRQGQTAVWKQGNTLFIETTAHQRFNLV